MPWGREPRPARCGCALQAEELRALLRSALGWDYSFQVLGEGEEGDESGPVVVELPEGRGC
jgi:hypothetical protein